MNAFRKLATVAASFAVIGPIALASAPSALATTTTEPHGCKTGVLPVTVIGSPGVKAKQALGVYLWHDGNGYSLRATQPGSEKIVISGMITVSRTIHNVKRIALETKDSVRVSGNTKTVAFRFTNYGYIDGFNFTADCSKTVKVAVRIGESQATPAQVFLGKDRTNPTSVPFTIERATTASAARVY